jgi:hypothetical protein
MGLKWRGVIRCGACGQPRGLGTHLCSPGRRKRRRHRAQNPVTWECSACHKPRGLRHTCVIRTDFKKRKRAAARRRVTAERQRRRKAATARRAERRRRAAAERRAREKARKAAAAAKRRTRAPRPRGDGHEPGTCGDRDCPRYGCKAFFDGIDSCPRPHEGPGGGGA